MGQSKTKPLNKRLAQGETEAFVELYDLLGEQLLRYLTARLNSNDAHDVLQEVFTRLVRYHRRLGKSPNLNAYVFMTARNEANRWISKNQQQSRSQSIDFDFKVSDNQISAEQRIEQHETTIQFLSQLQPDCREIVELKIFSDLTFAEIASIVKLPDATVATKYRRAILKMQSSIDARLQTETASKPKTG